MNEEGRKTYLDYNATAPVRPEAALAVVEALKNPSNASSVHSLGREARRIIEEARQKLAASLGAEGARIIFCSSGTEANNAALAGFRGKTPVISAIEHASVVKAVPSAEVIPVDDSGVVDLLMLEKILAECGSGALVSLMLANNETGVVQPVREAAVLARKYGALLHTDAIQAFGKIPVNMKELGADIITVSAHKMGGPQGAAALVIRSGLDFEPLIKGGGQEKNMRGGTENLAAIAGFSRALDFLPDSLASSATLSVWRAALEKELKKIAPDCLVFGEGAERLPGVSCVTMPGVPGATQVIAMDMAGVMVSSGAACSSGKVETSRVLLAMGVSPENAGNAIRISMGYDTKQEDLERFREVWKDLYLRTRGGNANGSSENFSIKQGFAA